jgi:hypothetical protein
MTWLPKNNIVGKVEADKALLQTSDWEAAKSAADVEAAQRIIAQLWTPKKTKALKALIYDATDVVMVSQPSTTRCNVLPFALAQTLAKEIGARHFAGEQFYDVLHSEQTKHIPRLQRPFQPRQYALAEPQMLKDKLAGKTVLVTEDLLTTEGSVKHFIRALNDDGIKVRSVVALSGDPRLSVDDKTRDALRKALQEKGIDLPAEELADKVTRTEARGIVLLVNSVRTENGREKITRKLQGLLDRGAFDSLARDKEQEGDLGAQGKDPGHERAPQGISPWYIRENEPPSLKQNGVLTVPNDDQQAVNNRFLQAREQYRQANNLNGWTVSENLLDHRAARDCLCQGDDPQRVKRALETCSPAISERHPKVSRYVERTLAKALEDHQVQKLRAKLIRRQQKQGPGLAL